MKLALLCTLLVFAGASSSGWSPRMLASARELWAITLCSMPLVCCEDKQLETQTLGPGVIPTQGGILNLNKMIKQVTRKTPIFSYWPYGCHCGPGGKGQPKDASDWCCQNHDCCYAHLRQHRCHIHTDNYDYTFSQGDIQCSDKGSWCEQQLCACDKEVAFCLKRNLETYKRHLRHYWRPHCRGQTPTC